MTRTHDLLITNQLLYRLSYTSIFRLPKYYNSITPKKQDRNSKKSRSFFYATVSLSYYQVLQRSEFVVAVCVLVIMMKHVADTFSNAIFPVIGSRHLYADVIRQTVRHSRKLRRSSR